MYDDFIENFESIERNFSWDNLYDGLQRLIDFAWSDIINRPVDIGIAQVSLFNLIGGSILTYYVIRKVFKTND